MRNPRFNQKSLEGIRQEIANTATSGLSSSADNLADLVVHLAKAEGYDFAWRTFQHALEQGGPSAARSELFDLLTRGADDSWSGRTNDVKRARFDGAREAARDLRWTPEFREGE